jgi:uncharacterized membrane protein
VPGSAPWPAVSEIKPKQELKHFASECASNCCFYPLYLLGCFVGCSVGYAVVCCIVQCCVACLAIWSSSSCLTTACVSPADACRALTWLLGGTSAYMLLSRHDTCMYVLQSVSLLPTEYLTIACLSAAACRAADVAAWGSRVGHCCSWTFEV